MNLRSSALILIWSHAASKSSFTQKILTWLITFLSLLGILVYMSLQKRGERYLFYKSSNKYSHEKQNQATSLD
jgi:hypothetical protein